MRNTDGLVLRPLPVVEPERPTSRAHESARRRRYWDSLVPAQEAWARTLTTIADHTQLTGSESPPILGT
jgi:hypothetical protein